MAMMSLFSSSYPDDDNACKIISTKSSCGLISGIFWITFSDNDCRVICLFLNRIEYSINAITLIIGTNDLIYIYYSRYE
jgi:hypothetical protein